MRQIHKESTTQEGFAFSEHLCAETPINIVNRNDQFQKPAKDFQAAS
jgi:hypothetical protein